MGLKYSAHEAYNKSTETSIPTAIKIINDAIELGIGRGVCYALVSSLDLLVSGLTKELLDKGYTITDESDHLWPVKRITWNTPTLPTNYDDAHKSRFKP